MGPCDGAEFFRADDSGKPHEVLDGVLVRAPLYWRFEYWQTTRPQAAPLPGDETRHWLGGDLVTGFWPEQGRNSYVYSTLDNRFIKNRWSTARAGEAGLLTAGEAA